MSNFCRISRLLAKHLFENNQSITHRHALVLLSHQPNQTRQFHMSHKLDTMYEKRLRDKAKQFVGKKKFEMKTIEIKNEMSVRELADLMGRSTSHVFSCLDKIGYNVRSRRDAYRLDHFQIIVKIIQLSGMRYSLPKAEPADYTKMIEDLELSNDGILKRTPAPQTAQVMRPPCVTIMGHVDHGKTTLLDALRGTNVVDGEFGGITQHIGAFNCKLPIGGKDPSDRSITFLDTPGHAAYSTMRSRGAKCTDIIVLVIAAEDSIMAQTVESIQHAKLSGCKIIVAINKIDKATDKQIAKCKMDLLQHGLIPEELTGDIQVVPISALKRTNLGQLKEEIWACAETMELKGDRAGLVEGYIIESKQDVHKGKMATVLIKRGTLQKGSFLVAGNTWCKVKYLFDENSAKVDQAGLSQAVQVMGWKDLPNAGDEVLQMDSEPSAKNLVDLRLEISSLFKLESDRNVIDKKRDEHDELFKIKQKERRSKGQKFITESMYDKNGEIRNFNSDDTDAGDAFVPKTKHIILKTDVNGSLEAILNVLETYNLSNKVILDIVHFEVGPIKKTDLELAETFNASIYCFNLPVEKLEKAQTKTNIDIKHFNVIYKMFDTLKEELANLAPLEEQEEIVGEADIKASFNYDETNSKCIAVAGGRCVEGILDKKRLFKLIRNEEVVKDRMRCHSLKHIKTEINTVKRNVEFGISFDNFHENFLPGDKVVCYEIKMVKMPFEWNLGF